VTSKTSRARFAGIAKAQAIRVWSGQSKVVFTTVAGNGGKDVLPGSAVYDHLLDSIAKNRDPVQQVRVASYEALHFKLAARVLIDPRYVADDVKASIESALEDAFGFEKRALGQPVTAAEALRCSTASMAYRPST
jgi:hypothetical protein